MGDAIPQLADGVQPLVGLIALQGAVREGLDQMVPPQVRVLGAEKAGPKAERERGDDAAGRGRLAFAEELALGQLKGAGLLDLKAAAVVPVGAAEPLGEHPVSRVAQRDLKPGKNAVERLRQRCIALVEPHRRLRIASGECAVRLQPLGGKGLLQSPELIGRVRERRLQGCCPFGYSWAVDPDGPLSLCWHALGVIESRLGAAFTISGVKNVVTRGMYETTIAEADSY